MSALAQPDGRTRHYGVFYGLDAPGSDGPVALVHGNCQAESLRLLLDGPDLATVRMPPVHELTRSDLPHLQRWLARTRTLVTQPVRDGFAGLPLGTAQLVAQLPPAARVVRVPVIRFAGLYPAHALVRPPCAPSLTPPLVAYHDLRVLAEAAGVRGARMGVGEVRAVAGHSLAQLRAREAAYDTVVVSDLFRAPAFAQMRTLNHPGNVVWTAVAARVRARLGLPEHAVDPGRPLLDAIHAPREAAVVEAFGLADAPTDAQTVDGRRAGVEEVREAHLRFYAEHPSVVAAGLARHADALRLLGLA